MHLYEYMSTRLHAASHTLDSVRPAWVRGLYRDIAATMLTEGCEVNVYANDRGLGPHSLIRDVSYILHIPTIAELLNLFPAQSALPHVLVAPSAFAQSHYSVQGPIERQVLRSGGSDPLYKGTEVRVISPSVYTYKFDILRVGSRAVRHHPDCMLIHGCFVVGFVGRLATEVGYCMYTDTYVTHDMLTCIIIHYYYTLLFSRKIPASLFGSPLLCSLSTRPTSGSRS